MYFAFSNHNVQCIVILLIIIIMYNYIAHFAYTCNNLSKNKNEVAKCNNMWLVNTIQE